MRRTSYCEKLVRCDYCVRVGVWVPARSVHICKWAYCEWVQKPFEIFACRIRLLFSVLVFADSFAFSFLRQSLVLHRVHFKLVIIFQGQFNLHPLTDDAVVATVAAPALAQLPVCVWYTVQAIEPWGDTTCAHRVCKIARNGLSNGVLLPISLHH